MDTPSTCSAIASQRARFASRRCVGARRPNEERTCVEPGPCPEKSPETRNHMNDIATVNELRRSKRSIAIRLATIVADPNDGLPSPSHARSTRPRRRSEDVGEDHGRSRGALTLRVRHRSARRRSRARRAGRSSRGRPPDDADLVTRTGAGDRDAFRGARTQARHHRLPPGPAHPRQRCRCRRGHPRRLRACARGCWGAGGSVREFGPYLRVMVRNGCVDGRRSALCGDAQTSSSRATCPLPTPAIPALPGALTGG